MTEGDQVARPLGSKHTGELGRDERVAFWQRLQACRRLRSHPDGGSGDRPAPDCRLCADVHHVHTPAGVDVREPCSRVVGAAHAAGLL